MQPQLLTPSPPLRPLIQTGNIIARQQSGAPPVPTSLAATPLSGEVALSWTAAAGATYYKIWRSTASTGPYVNIAGSGTNSYYDSSPSNETTYYYEVSSLGTGGESAKSGYVSARPSSLYTALYYYYNFSDIYNHGLAGSNDLALLNGANLGSGTGPGGSNTLNTAGGAQQATFSGVISLLGAPAAWAISIWSMITTPQTVNPLAGYNYASGQWGRVFYLGVGSIYYATDAGATASFTIPTMMAGTWHHLVASSDGTTETYYQDGVSVHTNAATTVKSIARLAAINPPGGTYPGLNGSLALAKAWGRALTTTEVALEFNSGNGRML